ncbi:hypothetical protein COM08_27880 [Bacillus wiedmannii]|uniref:hypothetical protein n=1 Tax=Bacillus wiedmannii TaxID=1890302 RepID=UPI000BF42FF8|nr:hypothetical protein [Bacillus wiedmannii]PGC12747.1 hypothetical protein COM08_27880 [Bacillus wiedmannii]
MLEKVNKWAGTLNGVVILGMLINWSSEPLFTIVKIIGIWLWIHPTIMVITALTALNIGFAMKIMRLQRIINRG